MIACVLILAIVALAGVSFFYCRPKSKTELVEDRVQYGVENDDEGAAGTPQYTNLQIKDAASSDNVLPAFPVADGQYLGLKEVRRHESDYGELELIPVAASAAADSSEDED